jgi:Cu-processing system permease protein
VTGQYLTLFRSELFNLIRARWLLPYALVMGGMAAALLQFAADSTGAAPSLQELTLLILPLVSAIYSTIYWYNSESFTVLLLTQPVPRGKVYLARWSAISLGLSTAYVLSVGAACLAAGHLSGGAFLILGLGVALTMAFVGLGLLVGVLVEDKMKGIGITFVAWLYCALLHDALVFLVLSSLGDYPVEVPGLTLLMVNPIDLARITFLLTFDLTAMMGYTGRILQKILSGPAGIILSGATLALWIGAPLLLGIRAFRRRDL